MLKNIIKQLRKSNNFTQKELAEYLHIQRATYSRYENGTNTMSFETLCKLADLYDVSTDFLLERSPLQNNQTNLFIYLFKNASPFVQDLVLTFLKMGQSYKVSDYHKKFINGNDNYIPVITKYIESLPINVTKEINILAGDFAVIALDESMTGENIQKGDYVTFRPQRSVLDGEIALLIINQVVLIRKIMTNQNKILLSPSHKDYHPIVCTKNDFTIIGKMMCVLKKESLH